jgi:hypothetical protein
MAFTTDIIETPLSNRQILTNLINILHNPIFFNGSAKFLIAAP